MSEARGESLRETPDRDGAYPRLSDDQLAALAQTGERRRTGPGQVLFREGEVNDEFLVVAEGLVKVVTSSGGEERLVAVHGPGRFLGELNLLTGQASFISAIAAGEGEVLAVPLDALREVVAEDSVLGDLILRAYLIRRSLLIGLGTGFRIIGSRYSPDTRRMRDFASRNRLPHTWIDLEDDPAAETLLRELGIAPEDTPVVIWAGEKVLRNPTNEELAETLGLAVPDATGEVCDLLIVGAGPAGLAAAVYGASEGLSTVALDSVAPGGQAGTTSRIENYLGFPTGISGSELASRAVIQAEKFGAHINVPGEARALGERDGHHLVELDGGREVAARTVLIASGSRYRKLPIPRLEEFEGSCVYYAATEIEAQVCAGDPVTVVGGGNSAGQAAIFLDRTASAVTMVVREDDLAELMSRYLADRIERNPGIDVLLHSEVREPIGEDGALRAVVVEDNQTSERSEVRTRRLFVFIGAEPHAAWLDGQLALDDGGYILTGLNGSMLETSRPGVFAAGDVRSGSIKRVASAVGEGSIAVRLVHEHLHGHDRGADRAQTNVSSK